MVQIKNRWFLPTNTNNLKMMVAQGLISSPEGFSPNKYYKDELENYSGYIPLFKNKIPSATLELIISEEARMVKCLIEIDLDLIEGVAKNKSNDQDVTINADADEDILLLPAPLPLSCIKHVILSSDEDKKELESDQKMNSNFILAELKLRFTKADQKLFVSNDVEGQLALSNESQENKSASVPNDFKESEYRKTYAFGGLLANLFYFAKNGEFSNALYQNFITVNSDNAVEKDILYLYQYFYNTSSSVNDLKTMHNKLVEKAVHSSDFNNDMINLLGSDVWDEKLKARTHDLREKLKNFENNDTTISAKFEAAKTPLEKLLLMLIHRESTEELMQYQLDLFTEEDYLRFALLFGIRDKFIRIPPFLRQYQKLQNFLSFKMAEYAHKTMGSTIKFKSPSPPETIWAVLNKNKIRKRAIEKLALNECAETIMTGDFRYEKGKAIYQGFVEPKYEIINNKYFKLMSTKEIDDKLYNELSKLK